MSISKEIKWEKLATPNISMWEIQEKIHIQKKEVTKTVWDKAFITLSRTHGACGDIIAKQLAQKLDWEVYDRDLIHYIAKDAKVRDKVVETLDEHKPNPTENWLSTVFNPGQLDIGKYHKHLVQVLGTLAQHGRAVIIGRGSNFIFNSPFGLRILITAPKEHCIEKISEKFDVSKSDAKKRYETVEKQRSEFINHHFHQNVNDPAHYDLTLNAATMSKELIVETIINSLAQKLGTPVSPSSKVKRSA